MEFVITDRLQRWIDSPGGNQAGRVPSSMSPAFCDRFPVRVLNTGKGISMACSTGILTIAYTSHMVMPRVWYQWRQQPPWIGAGRLPTQTAPLAHFKEHNRRVKQDRKRTANSTKAGSIQWLFQTPLAQHMCQQDMRHFPHWRLWRTPLTGRGGPRRLEISNTGLKQ